MYLHVSKLGCYCTCARARVVPRSRKRLNRLRSNLVQRWGPVSRVACKSQLRLTLHVRTCRVTVPDLKNGWADRVQIWYKDRDRLVGCRATCKSVGSIPTQFCTCRAQPRLSPQKASYWFQSLYFPCISSVPHSLFCLLFRLQWINVWFKCRHV